MTQGPQQRKFFVTVNGVRHEVIVEEAALSEPPQEPATRAGQAADSEAAQDAPSSSPPAQAEGSPGSPATAAGTNHVVTAPMPGLVTALPVGAGDAIAVGDVLVVLTAMKMENEIVAEISGTVHTVHVKEGQSVNAGDALLLVSS